MRIFLFFFFLGLAIFLFIAGLKNWIKNDTLDRLDKIGSFVALLIAIATLIYPSETPNQTENNVNSISSPNAFPTKTLQQAISDKPSNVESPINSNASNSTNLYNTKLDKTQVNSNNSASQQEITETLSEGETKRFFNEELIISLNDVYYKDSVSFTVGSTGLENMYFERKPLSFTTKYKAKHKFFIRVTKIDYIQEKVEFNITSIK